MTRLWFKPFGWIYRPVSPTGWLLTLAVVALSIWVGAITDRHSHSASDTLIDAFPYVAIFVIALGWTARNTSRP